MPSWDLFDAQDESLQGIGTAQGRDQAAGGGSRYFHGLVQAMSAQKAMSSALIALVRLLLAVWLWRSLATPSTTWLAAQKLCWANRFV
jgi:hypothetical protein